MADPALASCPVCGNRAEFRQPHEGPEIVRQGWYVVCEYNCVRQVGANGTKQGAAEHWNRKRKLLDRVDDILDKALRELRSARSSDRLAE